MNTAIYLRVSTDEQRERQTIATQRDFAERFCELNGVPVYAYYADDGISGTVPLEERPEGARLLHDAEAQKFDAVMVYKLDRLGRDPRLILNAVATLESLGVQIKSMTEPFDTATPAGRFLLTILSGVAGLERDTIVERSVEGTNRLARVGAWLGGIVPYGYRVVGKGRDARLVVSEEKIDGIDMSEADVIKMMYRLTAEERWSPVRIAIATSNAPIIPPPLTRNTYARSAVHPWAIILHSAASAMRAAGNEFLPHSRADACLLQTLACNFMCFGVPRRQRQGILAKATLRLWSSIPKSPLAHSCYPVRASCHDTPTRSLERVMNSEP